MDACPKCHRKLLSQASARCNWCGELIEDEAYQKEAALEREAYHVHEAESDELTLARTRWIDTSNSVMGRQLADWSNGPISLRSHPRPERPFKVRGRIPDAELRKLATLDDEEPTIASDLPEPDKIDKI